VESTTPSKEEGREILRLYFEQFGIQDINLDELQLRPDQFEMMRQLMGADGPRPEVAAFEGAPGMGKTLLAVIESLQVIKDGAHSIIVTTQHKLVEQGVAYFRRVTKIPNLRVAMISGETSPAKRKQIYAGNPQLILTTKNTLANDLDLLDLSRVGLVYFDETQYTQGADPGVALVRRIREISQARRGTDRPLSVRAMSGTLAGSEPKLISLLTSLQPDATLAVLTKAEIAQRNGSCEQGEIPGLTRKLFIVEMDPQLRGLANELRNQAVRCEEEIESHFKVPTLFRVRPDDPSFRVPSFQERENLYGQVCRFKERDEDLYFKLISYWAELNRYCSLFNRLTCLGRAAFLDSYIYLFCKRHISSRLYLAEIEGEAAVKDRYRLSQADKRVLGNESLGAFVAEMVKDTPFAIPLEYRDWSSISDRSFTMLDRIGFLSPTHSSDARKTIIDRANQSLARNKVLSDDEKSATALARNFFDDALRFMARRELPDSSKLGRMSEILNLHREDILAGRSFVFTAQTRHTDFLTEWLDWRTADSGFKPVGVHGREGAGMNAHRKVGLSGFKGGEYNVLCTTVPYAGTGIDVPNAKLAVFYCLPDSNPVNLTQAMGRVYGRADMAYVYVLSTKGTMEATRFYSALKKEEKRRTAVLRRAKIVG
jgi:hypothetical protein